VWSAEVLVYTICAYVAFSALELWAEDKGLAAWVAGLLGRLEQMAIAAAAANAVLIVMIKVDSGRWPDYTLYFDYLKEYNSGLATHPLDPRTAWFLLASLPVAGMVASLLLALRKVRARELALIAGLSAMAAAQYSYFLTRSHPSNLRFILLPSVTAVAVAIDLLLAQRSLSRLFRWSAAAAVAGLMAITLLQAQGLVLAAQPATRWVPELAGRPGWAAFWDVLKHPPGLHDRANEAVNLAKKYYGDSKQGTFLIQGEAGPVAHIQAGMIEVSDFTNVDEDGITPSRITDGVFDPRLKAGDIVIMEGNTALFERLQAQRYNSLKARFTFTILECGPANICAARLDPL
jgi:hypothetical protein